MFFFFFNNLTQEPDASWIQPDIRRDQGENSQRNRLEESWQGNLTENYYIYIFTSLYEVAFEFLHPPIFDFTSVKIFLWRLLSLKYQSWYNFSCEIRWVYAYKDSYSTSELDLCIKYVNSIVYFVHCKYSGIEWRCCRWWQINIWGVDIGSPIVSLFQGTSSGCSDKRTKLWRQDFT